MLLCKGLNESSTSPLANNLEKKSFLSYLCGQDTKAENRGLRVVSRVSEIGRVFQQ